MEGYIDNMLIKSVEVSKHIQDLNEAFGALWWHQMRLNMSKCAFGVTFGKFLRFFVIKHGIEANPMNIQAILDLKHLISKKKVQWLTKHIVALSHFIARLAK